MSQTLHDRAMLAAYNTMSDNFEIEMKAYLQVLLDDEETVEEIAKAIFFADPNFHGWKAVPKDDKYWLTDPAIEDKRNRGMAVIATLKRMVGI